MYKNIKLSTAGVLLMSGVITGCESLPKNVGVASSSSEIGVVYTAKVKAIYPIFVKPDIDHSSSDGVGVLAEALTERVFGLSSSGLADASSEFARAATGMYEERYAGLYCHYILEVDGNDLLNELGVDNDNDDEDRFERRSRSRSFRDEDEDEDENYRSRGSLDRSNSYESRSRPRSNSLTSRSSVNRTVDRRVENRMNDLWGRLEETLGEWEGVSSIEVSQNSPKAKRIFVVNPCRNFRIESSVTISKGDETVILQPSF